MMDVNAKDVSIYGISKEGELDSFSILHMSANLCEVTCEENADYYDYQSIRIKTDSEKKYTFKIKQAGFKDWSVYDTVCIFFISEKSMCMFICKNISQKFNELTKELILFCTNPTMVMFDESYGHNSEFIMTEYLRKYYSHPIYRGRELIRFPDIEMGEEKKEKPILADERFYFIEVITDVNDGRDDREKKHQLFEVPYHKYFDLIRGQTLLIKDTERYYTNDGERHWLQRASNYNPHFGYKIVNKYDFDTLKDAYDKIKEINNEVVFEGIYYSFWNYILKYTLYDGDKIINEVYNVMEDKWETMVRNTPVTSSASIEINKESSERERVEIQAFKKRFEELRDKVENSRRKNSMNNIFKNINIQFGEIKTDQIKYSFNGIAFKNTDGTYSTYDINTNTLTNVSDLIMDIPMYVMPAAIKDIKTGDIVIHKGIVYVIKEIVNDNFTAIQPNAGTMTTLIPEKSIFGYSYMSRVMNIMETFKANEDNPFGNMLPFFMMNKENNNDTLALMMMMQGNQDFNKVLPFMLMGKEDIDPISMMLLMNFNK